jgi:hypothetical protein
VYYGKVNDNDTWIDDVETAVTTISTWPKGAIAIFGIGGKGKSPLVNKIANVTSAPTVSFLEPDGLGSVSDSGLLKAFTKSVVAAASTKQRFVVIDSYRIPFRLTPGGGAKSGGLAPGFDRAMTALSMMAVKLGLTVVVVVNPAEPEPEAMKLSMLAASIGESSTGIIDVVDASVEAGYTVSIGMRPYFRYASFGGGLRGPKSTMASFHLNQIKY